MRAVSMESSGRWAVVSTQSQPPPLPSHFSVIRLPDSFACSAQRREAERPSWFRGWVPPFGQLTVGMTIIKGDG